MIILISKKKILELAKINNLKPTQQERHYLQNLILILLGNYNIIFKGGTYLWFCHNLNRFSEDLDFAANGPIDEKLATELLSILKSRGVNVRINDITNTPITLSFKLGIAGPLFNDNDRSRCFLWIEISKRENLSLKPNVYDIYFPYYDLESKIIRGMDLNEVFAEKVRDLLTREKARDIYDLYFLIKYKNIVPDYALINKKFELYNSIFNKTDLNKILKSREELYKTDLKGLIFTKLPEFKEVYETIISVFK
ncbi:MAG: hypothetical protein COT14_04015 [Candidatus Diapherotrites archaeon CG08_land_8_20_14_0_20_30_16]|nr:MAG: hypothetical protein COT14_04015 [Candidatus Diapherotrites archaeon CG08_land_8_20_14_0_20_30_16]